jgi:hypothetical protein
MKRVRRAFALFGSILMLVLSAPVTAQPTEPEQTIDIYQRFIRIRNSLEVPIYPVIQSPQDAPAKVGDKGTNCGTGGLLRIVVNKDKQGAGIPSKETVTVALPKDKPCTNGGFYDASRIYILVAEFDAFEELVNSSQRTTPYPNWDYANYPVCAGCWVGSSTADYGHDAPGQLLEYTIISQNPADGSSFPNPNDTRGTPLLDFDVSYVDDAHLPVAMGIDDGGATQFMGSTLPPVKFNERLTNFLSEGNWSRYAAYAPLNWATSEECPTPGTRPTDKNKTTFSCLLPRTDRVPSANILITDAQTGGVSSFYLPSWDGVTPKECNTAGTSDPTANLMCSTDPPYGAGLKSGNCCPQGEGVMLGCCDSEKFLIDKTHRKFIVDQTTPAFRLSNETLANLVSRFTQWQGAANDPCADSNGEAITTAPVVDKKGFCTQFKKTLDFVWKQFAPQCPSRGDAADRCIAAAIIGYDLKNSTFDASKCKKCPNADENICPRSCGLEEQRNASVQALQRGLPWFPPGDPDKCGTCPSETSCANTCILPVVPSAKATVYQLDKFLHFWAPYKSIYNLNPFARFVHNYDQGLAAPGAYSFSIDDFYGNFGGPGSTLIIDIGSYAAMRNQEPFDPFKQYHAGVGTGWHHAKVCGRNYQLPATAPANVGLSTPVAFWSEGQPIATCEVRVYPTANEANYIVFQLTEVDLNVKDDYTGQFYPAKGLSGVYAVRFPTDQPTEDAYCTKNSTARNLVAQGFCKANLVAGQLNLAYVGVSDAPCVGKPNDATCGRPLINLNVPSLTAVAAD